MDVFAVKQTSDKYFPPRDILDFIKEERAWLILEAGVASKINIRYQMEV